MDKIDTIVTAPGSLGDVNPMLAIARILQSAGRNVLFLAAEQYLRLAERAGLRTRILIDRASFDHFVSDPRLWHPRHGARQIFEKAVDSVIWQHFAWLEENCTPGETLLVSHILDFAGRIYRDKYPQTRMVTVVPAPVPLRSTTAPPRVSSFFWERWLPRFSLPALYYLADRWVDRIGAREINALRLANGLPPVNRILKDWWWSPDLVLALFPEWFSVPQQDLPSQFRLVGFPLADSADIVSEVVADELQGIMADLQPERPIVFAPGTANHHGRKYLTHAVEACAQADRAAILISNDLTQIPENLPPRVRAARYLPFSQLLPQAAAIVHHGGVGTTSQAFAAGIPQVVLPMAFDQFDNAERVRNLECGAWLPMHRLTTERLSKKLQGLAANSRGVAQVKALIQSQPSFAEAVRRHILES